MMMMMMMILMVDVVLVISASDEMGFVGWVWGERGEMIEGLNLLLSCEKGMSQSIVRVVGGWFCGVGCSLVIMCMVGRWERYYEQ